MRNSSGSVSGYLLKMGNQYRSQVTAKGVENIFRVLCESDPRCGQYTFDARFLTERSSEAVYPLCMLRILSSDIVELGNLHYTKWNVELWALTMRRDDWSNEVDAYSECQVLLNDTVLRFRAESEVFRKTWGFRFPEGSKAEIRFIDIEGRDDLLGASASISFLTPLTLCAADFPVDALPDIGLYYSAATVTIPSTYLTCSSLSACTTIQGIEQDIETLYSLTGSTFSCQDFVTCPDFQSLSSTTISLASIASAHNATLALLSGATGSNTSAIADLSGIITAHAVTLASLSGMTAGNGADIITLSAATASNTAGLAAHSSTLASLSASTSSLNSIAAAHSASLATLSSSTSSLSVTTAAHNASLASLSSVTLAHNVSHASLSATTSALAASSAHTAVQAGLNITTGGTASSPIVNLAGSIIVTGVTTNTLNANGSNNLDASSTIISRTGFVGDVTKPTTFINVFSTWDTSTLSLGRACVFSAGTGATQFIVNILGEFAAGLRVNGNISGTTFYSGSTPLNYLLGNSSPGSSTYVQPGVNITTGGTASAPVVNINSSIALTSVSATTLTGVTSVTSAKVNLSGALTGSTSASTVSNYEQVYARRWSNRDLIETVGSNGQPSVIGPHFAYANVRTTKPIGNGTTTLSNYGVVPTTFGTPNAGGLGSGSILGSLTRVNYNTGTVAGTTAGIVMTSVAPFMRGNIFDQGGFFVSFRFGIETVATNHRWFVGMATHTSAPGNIQPSSQTNVIGFGCDSGQTTVRLMVNDASGTATSTDLGASFPATTANVIYDAILYCAPNDSTVYCALRRLDSGNAYYETSVNSDIPAASTLINPVMWINNADSAAAARISHINIYSETKY